MCAVSECDRTATARGWCKRHYEIWRRHGDASYPTRAFNGRGRNGEPLEDKLIRKSTVTPTGCREWNGWRDAGGYGRVAMGQRMRPAHVASWEVANGQIVPDGMVVRHRCDNPACIEPTHLVVGTQAQNVADMIERGRCDRRGERNNSARLTDESVRSIRAKHAVGVRVANLAAEYSVSVSQIKNIVTNKQWKESQ